MKLISILLIFSLLLVTTPVIYAQTAQETLTNDSIVQLTKAGLSADAIIEKIKASTTNFDLSTTALTELKSAGIADSVILQMIKGNAPPLAEPVSIPPTEEDVVIPDGTEVEVQLKNSLSGQEAKVGDIVDLTVVKDVAVNGLKVIPQGASATARITAAKKAGYWGKKGNLEWKMDDIQTVSGIRIPSRFTKTVSGETRSGTVAVGAVVTTVLLGPIGLLWGLKKGKPAVIPSGTKFSVYTDKDSTIKIKTQPI